MDWGVGVHASSDALFDYVVEFVKQSGLGSEQIL